MECQRDFFVHEFQVLKSNTILLSNLSNYYIIRVTLNAELDTAAIRRRPRKMAYP